MPEQVFKRTVFEGQKRRFTVINEQDFEKCVPRHLKEKFRLCFHNVADWGRDAVKEMKRSWSLNIVVISKENTRNFLMMIGFIKALMVSTFIEKSFGKL